MNSQTRRHFFTDCSELLIAMAAPLKILVYGSARIAR
jgi:hypothetical protein